MRGWATLRPGFLPWCFAFGVSQTLATLALSKALTLSAISLVTPLWKVSLLGLMMMGYAVGERPAPLGLTGVVLSAVGVYLLNVSRARISAREPLRVLVTDRGQRDTLLAAFLYGPAVLTFKQVILASDPTTGTFAGYAAASLIMTPVMLAISARHLTAVSRHWAAFTALGLFATLTSLTHGIAYTLTLASYVEAVKQVDVIFAMAAGILIFKESERIREVALGATAMLLGMVFLALAG